MPDALPASSPDLPVVDKVLIYVFDPTLRNVLTFVQPAAPDAGRQIPAGTVEPGEDAATAAHRELAEETGVHCEGQLHQVATTRFDVLGDTPEVHRRAWFYLVDDAGAFPTDTWQHDELRSGAPAITAQFEWMQTFHATGSLIAGHGNLLLIALNHARAAQPGPVADTQSGTTD